MMTTLSSKFKNMDMMWKYVIFAYLLFWFMVMGICGTASMVFNASPLTMRWLANLCAWSPTFALLIMFKKLRPNMTIKEFFLDAFGQKLRLDLLLLSTVAVIGGILLTVWALSVAKQLSFSSFFSLGAYSLPLASLLSFLSGPTGEESGWRGYLRPELNSKYGFVKGSLILGVVWAFWHTILWFVDSDFAGLALILYIISNVVVMTSLVIIMNVVLDRSNNLFNAIWIHFSFNVLYSFLVVDIWFFVILSVVFALIGACYLMYHLKQKAKSSYA
jgi:membrane protease YdiL (CAAX protease family)